MIHFLSTQHCFRTPLPPYLFISLQKLHFRQFTFAMHPLHWPHLGVLFISNLFSLRTVVGICCRCGGGVGNFSFLGRYHLFWYSSCNEIPKCSLNVHKTMCKLVWALNTKKYNKKLHYTNTITTTFNIRPSCRWFGVYIQAVQTYEKNQRTFLMTPHGRRLLLCNNLANLGFFA